MDKGMGSYRDSVVENKKPMWYIDRRLRCIINTLESLEPDENDYDNGYYDGLMHEKLTLITLNDMIINMISNNK